MSSTLFGVVTTLIYGLVGLIAAFPLSYFFQDGLYSEISWLQYISAGTSSIWMGAEFGALDVYRYTAMASVIIAVFIGKWAEQHFAKNKN